MVFSSFTAPKQETKTECSQSEMKDGKWTEIGRYKGYTKEGKSEIFTIYRKNEDFCGKPEYWWTSLQGFNPDEVKESGKGILRQNSEGKWYAAYNGNNYYIDF